MDCNEYIQEFGLQLALEEKQQADLSVGVATGVFPGMSRFDLHMREAFRLFGALVCLKTCAKHLCFCRAIGGAEGDRTPDLDIANVALSQLSYGPLPMILSQLE
tara:strand:+ start:231 stop:542 length:312 start_codon:yes stop_codon:yes gene_type:complete